MAERLSDLADALWPHLARRVALTAGGGAGAALNVASPTDHGALTGLLDDDHPQYLTVGRGDGRYPALADWTTHIGNADAHHARLHVLATNAGLGADHTISGAAAGHVLRASSATAAAFAQLAHSDLSAIGTNTHAQIDTHIATSDIHVAHSGVSILAGDGLTGGGTIAASRTLNVAVANTLQSGAGGGLSVEADAVRLTASHNPGAAAAVLASDATGKLTLPLLVASSSVTTPLVTAGAGQSLTLQAPLDLILDPTSDLVRMGSGASLQASSYASQTTGWRITDAGEADFRYMFVDEMHAKSFIADLEQALAGGQIIAKSVAVVATAFTLPTAGNNGTLRVRDLPSAPNMAVFQSGDFVGLRLFSRAEGSLTIGWAWGTVTNYVDGTGGNEGTQTWTFTRHATTPGAATGTIPADALVLDFGVSGNGFYEVNAIDGAYGANSPYAQVVTWATHPATQTVRARMGNLRGIFSVADEFGLYAGSGTAVTDRYIRASNSALELRNVPLALFDGSANTLLLSAGTNNNSPFLAMGSPLPDGALTNDGIWAGLSEATTNLFTNPSFETNTTGLTAYNTGTPTGTRARSTDFAKFGAYSYKIDKTGGAAQSDRYGVYNSVSVVSGQTYTFSVWVKVSAISGGLERVWIQASQNVTTAMAYIYGVSDWQRVVITTTATGTGSARFYVAADNCDTGTIYVDGFQCENRATATEYCDGSLGADCAWTGTAHASTSVRTGGYKLRVGEVSGGTLIKGMYWDGANLVWKATNTSLDSSGNLTASNATLSGQVTATSGSIAGVLSVGTDGGIYQGTGTFASPTTGLKIWNDSGVGRIGGYNAGALQWYAGTDGKLYAGGGSVWIDTNGLNANIALAGSDVKFWGGLGTQVGAISGFSDLDAHLYIYALHSAKTTDLRVGVSNSTSPNYLTSITFTDTEAQLDAPKITVSAASQGTWFVGHVYPNADLTYNLGSASKRWGTVYANNMVVSGAISGETLGGAEWEYAGSMVIDANAASNTTVSIVNQNASYTASLDVEGNITLGGLVDGVDLAAFKSAYDSHSHSWSSITGKPSTFAPSAHALVGSDHSASGLSAGHVVRASGPTTFAWAQLAHSDLSGIGTNTHTQIDSHIAATAAHGVSGAIVGTTDSQTLSNKTLTTPTIASFANAQHAHTNAASGGTIAHGSLTGIGANDHHSQAHVLASTSGLGADHTVAGLTAGHVLRASSATAAAFGAIEDADLPSTIVRTSRQITAGNGLTGGGALSADVTVTMGTPSTLSASSTNAVTTTSHTHSITTGAAVGLSVSSTSAEGSGAAIARADHTHAITSSSNPGAAASILASTAAGALTLVDLTVTALTATRLVASDASDKLVSTSLASWMTGTANRVTVADDGDGTVTLSAPQDIHTGATPTFGGLITPWLRPAADSTTAIQLRTSGGTAILTVDTTNSRIGIGNTPAYKLDVSGDVRLTGTLYADGGIVDFGTNYFQEGATYLELKGAKPFYLNQTIQASGWSMSAGGALVSSSSLSAASLALTGAATITGDLTVGGTVLQVSAAGTRVGINRAADQQFDLDVAGAIRGQYLVGPHALQLSDAKAIVHFDGPAPYNLDFSGTSNTHMGENATETGGVIYRPGKFGKAVQLAEATTNLVANPSFEADTTGWSGVSGTLERVTGQGVYGDACARLSGGTTSAARIQGTINVLPSTTYTISGYIYKSPDSTSNPYLKVNQVSGTVVSASQAATITGQWQRVSVTITTPADVTQLYIRFYVGLLPNMAMIDAVQFEQKAYATPYCDGSLGAGHSWSGTAHASTSSRTNATITYPANNVVGASAGTIMFWAKPSCLHAGDAASSPYWIYHAKEGSNRIYVRQYNSSWAIALGNGAIASGGTPTVDVWTHLCVTWNNGEGRLFVDGQQVGTVALYTSLSELGTLAVGYSSNGLIDDLILLDYAADPKLIRSIYESNAPVFAESSVVSFRAPTKSQIWLDEFGFWAKGQSGGEAFGIFGGDPRRLTTTKSWGGVTMEENDIVIGRTSAPSYTALHWDDSAGELILGRQSGEHISLTAGYVRIKNTTTTYASLNNAEFILGNVAEENLRLTTSGIEFRNATEVQGSLSGTSWTLGKTGTGENNVQITPTTLSLRSGTNKHAELTSAGVLTLGLVSSGDYLTVDGTNGVRLYGNSSLLGQWTAAGGVVIGAVANSTSRIEITSGAVNIINRSAGGADTTAISLSSSGSATFTGQITATTGAVGGWTISESSLTGGSATLSNTGKLTLGTSNNVLIADAADANYRLYIGHTTPASAPFSVTKTGGLTSSLGVIGGWTITSDRFQGGADARLYSTGKMALGSIYGMVVIDPNHADWRIWSGVAADIESNPLSSQFRVSKQGQLTASGATIYGHLVANSGDIAGVLTIGTDGGIYQGTGTFASATTGLKIWNDSGAGRIGGYNTGTLQWYAGTDGKLYAGGGNVRLDAGGVAVAAPTTYYSAANAFGFTRAGVAVGGLLALATASETAMVIGANTVDASAGNPVAAESNRDARVAIWAKAQGTGKHAALELKALAGDGVNSAQITMGTNASPWLQLSATTITLDGNVECAYEVDFGSWCRVAKLVVDGDPGGVSTGEIALSNQTSDVSTGVGTVKMGGASNANSTGWLKIYVAGNARYIPFWSVIAG